MSFTTFNFGEKERKKKRKTGQDGEFGKIHISDKETKTLYLRGDNKIIYFESFFLGNEHSTTIAAKGILFNSTDSLVLTSEGYLITFKEKSFYYLRSSKI